MSTAPGAFSDEALVSISGYSSRRRLRPETGGALLICVGHRLGEQPIAGVCGVLVGRRHAHRWHVMAWHADGTGKPRGARRLDSCFGYWCTVESQEVSGAWPINSDLVLEC